MKITFLILFHLFAKLLIVFSFRSFYKSNGDPQRIVINKPLISAEAHERSLSDRISSDNRYSAVSDLILAVVYHGAVCPASLTSFCRFLFRFDSFSAFHYGAFVKATNSIQEREKEREIIYDVKNRRK